MVVLSGSRPTQLQKAPLDVRQGGSWRHLTDVTADVPAAPDTVQVAEADVPAGDYSGFRLGGAESVVSFSVTAGKVEPVLLGVVGQSLEAGAVYAGTEAVNLGLGELGGKYTPLPAFSLVDQAGRTVTQDDLHGRPTVVAAFHTTCRTTCPLYTGLLLQLQDRLQARVHLVEVTTDPADTPSVLRDYAGRVGARWEMLTGTASQLRAFWAPFQVELAAGDSHVSTLVIGDAYGYVRLVYRGIPDQAGLPAALTAQLNQAGLAELGHGDGWGSADVLRSLQTLTSLYQPRHPGGRAPAFSLPSLEGSRIGWNQLAGQPLVLNFWASYCPACAAEMPQLARAAAGEHGVVLLFIDERDDRGAARAQVVRLGLTARVGLDPDGRVGAMYGVSALPTTVFIRPDGTIASVYLGQMDAATMSERMAAIAAA